MRWTPGLRSADLEDRRFEWSNPEAVQAVMEEAARRGELIHPEINEWPPWTDFGPTTQETLINRAAFQRAFGLP